MNHPDREEFVPYLFGEDTPETRRRLHEHLGACPQCQAEVESWRRSLRRLDAWRTPTVPRPSFVARPGLSWAFALLTVVGLAAFLLGRFTSRAEAEAKLQEQIAARLKPELTAELRQVVREEVAKAADGMLATSREESGRVLAAYERVVNARLEAERMQRISDCLALKKDVDTIAVNADAGLRDTEQRLAQMVVYRRSPALANPLIDNPTHH